MIIKMPGVFCPVIEWPVVEPKIADCAFIHGGDSHRHG
jgi:hypothetical protein